MQDVSEKLWSGEKFILGPMVRANSLPLRLACLKYGADVVYSEEIPSFRAVSCKRFENSVLNTVDFVRGKDDKLEVLFRTHVTSEKEQSRCVLQIGASESVSALKAAQVFEKDVAAIDINMGCPKHYSVSRGMGSELMIRPEAAEDIIKTLRRNLSIPISVKTRIFAKEGVSSGKVSDNDIDLHLSCEWVNRLVACGAQAVAVHARTAKEKSCDATHDVAYNSLRDALDRTKTPLIYNGDIWGAEDIARLKRDRAAWISNRPVEYCDFNSVNNTNGACGASDDTTKSGGSNSTSGCFMLCRAALWDPSIFATLRNTESNSNLLGGAHHRTSDQSVAPLGDLLSTMLMLSAYTANCPLNTRYLLQQILAARKLLNSDVRGKILKVFDLSGLSSAIGSRQCEEYVLDEKTRQQRHYDALCRTAVVSSTVAPNDNDEDAEDIVDSNVQSVGGGADEASGADKHTQPAAAAAAVSKYSRVQNSSTWPGLVSLTSHEYQDRYFDDNYYIAFRKCVPQHVQQAAKRPFAYSQFSTVSVSTASGVSSSGLASSSCEVVRVKRNKS